MKAFKLANKGVSTIGAAWNTGQRKPGVEKSPALFRSAGMIDVLAKDLQLPVIDLGDISEDCVTLPTLSGQYKYDSERIRMIGELNKNLSDIVYKESQKGRLTLALGGDHSMGHGTAHGQLKTYGDDLRIIWFDAHADLNTYDTSMTGNFHGMSLAYVLGIGNSKDLAGFDWVEKHAKPENVVLIGSRDLDDLELDFIRDHGVKYYSPRIIDEMGGIGSVMRDIHSYLRLHEAHSPLHVSFDVDGCCSSFMPAVGTPVDYGLSKRESKFFMQKVHEWGNMTHMDVTELNIDYDTKIRTKTPGDNKYIKTEKPTLFTTIELTCDAFGLSSKY